MLWKSRRAYVVETDLGPLLVMPGVLDPVATKVGAWLAHAMAHEVQVAERWVDMGCGTGVVGLAMASAGAEVVCADIDPACVRNARANGAARGLSLSVVESDLFDALDRLTTSDGVVYNAPFWQGDGRGVAFGRAMYAGADFEAIRRYRAAALGFGARRTLIALSEAAPNHAGALAAFGPHRRLVRERVAREWLVLLEAEASPDPA